MNDKVVEKLEVISPRNGETLNESLENLCSEGNIKDYLVLDTEDTYECYYSFDGDMFFIKTLGKV